MECKTDLRLCLVLVLVLVIPVAFPAPLTPDQCRAQFPDDNERLQCYDKATAATRPGSGARLYDAWQLAANSIPLSSPKLYRPIYIMVRYSDNTNVSPTSPTHPAPAALGYKRMEAKFQLSFKSELVSPAWFKSLIGSDAWRLWFAYTQQSNWQILDTQDSRPFRNTNYEPELILTQRIGKSEEPGWMPRLLNWGLVVHQSNGQSDPLSRSWNRSYLQVGWQSSENTSVLLRVWHRWKEDLVKDDNPDISSFAGSWDVALRGDAGETRYLLLIRHRYAQLDLSPRRWRLLGAPLHFQVTTGYGETLLDYNHRQTTVGVGWSFGEW